MQEAECPPVAGAAVNRLSPGDVRDEWTRRLHATHAEALHRFLLRLTRGSREAAEDLLQETMLRAWRNKAGLPDDVDLLRPWLFTVARNLAIDAGRANRARPAELDSVDVSRLAHPVDAFDKLLTAATVREALRELSPPHRTVLVELYFRGASTAETAARIGIPEGTVKSRAHYALRALRAALNPEGPPIDR